jgi:hypothetical protein
MSNERAKARNDATAEGMFEEGAKCKQEPR